MRQWRVFRAGHVPRWHRRNNTKHFPNTLTREPVPLRDADCYNGSHPASSGYVIAAFEGDVLL